jgi:type II secretory pathway predicted ATPase ExeA/HAMP domain-containing protein
MIQVRVQEHRTTVENHFGFRERPFGVTPDPRFFYNNPAYMKNLAELAHGIKVKKGLMLLTGEVGTGKTILLRKLMRDLDATVKFVFVSSSHLTPHGLLDLMSHELSLAKKTTRLEVSQELREYLLQQVSNGHAVALLIDEAQNISDRAFETLCGLSNLETDDEKLLQIVLVGQPELINKLNKPSLRQVKQRIATQHRLTGLQTKSELENYIHHRLQVAGYNGPEIFSDEALDVIWRYSSGTPRLVNIICDNSLALLCETGARNVSADVAIKATSGFELNREIPKLQNSEMVVVPMATLKPQAEVNGTTAEAKSSSVSPEFSTDMTGGTDLETRGSVPFSEQPAPLGRSRDSLSRKQKLTELIALVKQGSEVRSRKRIGLRWRIAGLFSGLVVILCSLLVFAAYHVTERTVREQLDKRALAIATNLSDASAGHIVGNDLLPLNTLLRKYSFLDGLAYAFVQNREGAIVAHSLATFPPELRQGLPLGRQRVASRRELSLQGKPIYETSAPVLDGQLGAVHVGFSGDAIENEIRLALLPMIGIIAGISLLGVVLSFIVAHWIARPIVRLAEVAEKITKGDLQTCGEYPNSRDEIGDLARSLERMRASLRAAMSRLGHELA